MKLCETVNAFNSYFVVNIHKSSAVAEMGDRGHNRHRPKRGGCCALFAGAAWSPSNTMWTGPKSTSVPSGVFIHPAAWPQYIWAESWGGAVPLLEELGPHITQSRLGRGLTPYQVAS